MARPANVETYAVEKRDPQSGDNRPANPKYLREMNHPVHSNSQNERAAEAALG
jgi:hypothetical protein